MKKNLENIPDSDSLDALEKKAPPVCVFPPKAGTDPEPGLDLGQRAASGFGAMGNIKRLIRLCLWLW